MDTLPPSDKWVNDVLEVGDDEFVSSFGAMGDAGLAANPTETAGTSYRNRVQFSCLDTTPRRREIGRSVFTPGGCGTGVYPRS